MQRHFIPSQSHSAARLRPSFITRLAALLACAITSAATAQSSTAPGTPTTPTSADRIGLTFDLAERTLTPAPTPVDNPLKGLVPYEASGSSGPGSMPHSMEFNYVPLRALMPGDNTFDWSRLDSMIAGIASRGKQTIFRVFMEYPGEPTAIPQWMIDAGVRTTRWGNPGSESLTPNYEDPRVVNALTRFIAALGTRYDNDVRVAYITAGLLGSWGEWHNWPRTDLWASKQTQTAVMNAYRAAFRRTPILLRYPAGPNDNQYAPNVTTGFGYHDDSFAFATLEDPNPNNGWYFMNLMARAGATDTWRTRPIGGEIRPEVWGAIFDDPIPPNAQNFNQCVDATHVTWLMDSGMFDGTPPPARRARAEAAVRRMGYDLTVTRVSVRANTLTLTILNRGVAPFYAEWPAEAALLAPNGSVITRVQLANTIAGILPNQSRTWVETLAFAGPKPAQAVLAIRVPNPMPTGKPVGFANTDYATTAPGWLTLGQVTFR